MTSAYGKFGKAAAKIATAAITAGATAVGILTKAAVSSYADYEQLVGGIDTLFKDSSKKVMDYANNAYKTAGLSANQYMETVTSFSASLLQSLGNDTAKAAEYGNMAVTDMSDNANKMGTAMETIIATYQSLSRGNYAMLDNLKLGYGGTKEEMERLIADAAKLDSTVKANDMSFSNMVKAIHAVQTEMGITGTTAKEASTTIQGSVASMKASWNNLLVGVAGGSQNMKQLVTNFSDSLKTVGSNLLPVIQTTLSGLGQLIQELLPPMLQQIPKLLQSILPDLLASAVQLVTQVFSALGQAIPELLNIFVNTLLPMVTNLLTQIGDSIGQNLPLLIDRVLNFLLDFTARLRENAGQFIDAGLHLILKLGEGIANALPDLIAKVPTIVSNIAGIINDNAPKLITTAIKLIATLAKGLIQAIPDLVANIPKIIKAIVDVFLAYNWVKLGKNLITKLKDGISNMAGKVKEAAGKIKDAVVNAIKALPSKLYNLAKSAVGKLVSILKHTARIRDAASAIKNEIVRVLSKLPDKLLEIGKNLVKGLWNGIKNAKEWVLEKIKGFGKSILDGIKGIFEEHSPSKATERSGKNLALGLVQGIKKNTKYAKKSAAEMAQVVLDAAQKKLDRYKVYNDMSLEAEVAYWDTIRKECKKGTDARLQADQNYFAAKAALDAQYITDSEEILNQLKRLYDLSAADEVQYWAEIAAAAKKGTDARIAAEEKYQAALDNYYKEYESYVQNVMGQMDLFKEYVQNEAITPDSLVTNLQSQIGGLESYYQTMADLQNKIGGTALYDYLEDLGVDHLSELQAVNGMADQQLQQYVELYNQKYELAQKIATEKLGEITTITEVEQKKANKETEKNMKTMADTLKKYAATMSDTTKKKFNEIYSTISNKMAASVSAVRSAVAQMQAALAEMNSMQAEANSKADAAKNPTSQKPTTNKTTSKKTTVKKHALGGILTEPTIFGFTPSTGTYHLGGEAGKEAVAPISTLQKYVRESVAEENAGLSAKMSRMIELLEGLLDKDTAVYLNSKEISKAVNKDLGVLV